VCRLVEDIRSSVTDTKFSVVCFNVVVCVDGDRRRAMTSECAARCKMN